MKKQMMLLTAAFLALVLAACQTLGPSWNASLEPLEGVETDATGSVTATLVAERLEVEGTLTGLSSSLVAGDYAVAITDAEGNDLLPVGFSPAGATTGVLRGGFEPLEATREIRDMLRAGQLYVIVRTENHPEGELWGQLTAN